MRFDGENVRKEFEESFGGDFEWTVRKLWWLVKAIKHCRMRCRNNNALNNWLNRNFPNFRFEQVTKTRQDGSTYPGLQITDRNTNETSEEEEDE